MPEARRLDETTQVAADQEHTPQDGRYADDQGVVDYPHEERRDGGGGEGGGGVPEEEIQVDGREEG